MGANTHAGADAWLQSLCLSGRDGAGQGDAGNPLAALNLNDEQRKRLIAIAKETQAANVKIMNEIAKEFEAVQKLSVAIKPECS